MVIFAGERQLFWTIHTRIVGRARKYFPSIELDSHWWLWAPVSFAAGHAIYFHWPTGFAPAAWLILAAFIGFLIYQTIHLAPERMLVRFLALLIISASCGAGHATFRTHIAQSTSLSEPMPVTMVEGWVTDVLPHEKGVRLLVRVHAISDLPKDQTPRYVRLTQRGDHPVYAGRFVRCLSGLNPPPGPQLSGDYDFQRQAFFEKIGAVGYTLGNCKAGALQDPSGMFARIDTSIASKRRALSEHVFAHSGDAGGVAASLLSGDRSFLDPEHERVLRDAGLAHLLAISGLHMGLAAGILYFISLKLLVLIEPLALRIPIQKLSAIVALMGITGYLVISGASLSSQRAYIMAAVALMAVVFDRTAISLRSLAIALMIILLVSPVSITSAGFQMSFLATGALIAAYEAWRDYRVTRSDLNPGRIRFAILSTTLTSIVAGAATAPVAIYHFERIANYGLIGNFTAMPVFTFVCAPLAGLVAVSSIFGLQTYTLPLFGESLEWVLQIAEWVAERRGAVHNLQSPMPSITFIASTFALIALTIHKQKAIPLAIGCVIFAGGIWILAPQTIAYQLPNGYAYISTNEGWREIKHAGASGLRPLRFRDVPPLECGKGDCVQSTEWGAFEYDRASGKVCAERTSGRPGGPICLMSDHTPNEVQVIRRDRFRRLSRERQQTKLSRPWHSD